MLKKVKEQISSWQQKSTIVQKIIWRST